MLELLASCGSMLCLGGVALVCFFVARALLRKPALLVLPLAFCVFIAFESVLLNMLSIFHGVTRLGLVIGQLLLLTTAFFHDLRRRSVLAGRIQDIRRELSLALRSPITPFVAPLVATLYVVAFVYPPNNYDSMTYHMARVAHWVANQSIEFIVTSNPRENDTGPGAETLLLVLQIFSGSDRFANWVQTTCFVILLVSTHGLVRLMRAPLSLRVPLVLLFATAPVFVLQATSTQNDLCAAVTALAIVGALRNGLFGRPRWKARDGIAVGLAVGVAYLVKPTALIFVSPVVVWAAFRTVRAASIDLTLMPRRLGPPLLAGLVTCAVICGPHITRKALYGSVVGATESEVIFPLGRNWLAARRVVNPLLAVAHHVPLRSLDLALGRVHAAASKLDPPGQARWGIDGFYAGHALRQYEDLAGAPIQFLATIALSTCGLFWGAWRRRRTAFIVSLLPLLGWLTFHWIARNNLWIARYHATWFALAVLSACGACEWARVSRRARFALVTGTWLAASLAVTYAWSTVVANEMRPVSSIALTRFKRNAAYYAHNPGLAAEHRSILKTAGQQACSSLLLLYGNDDVMEYQLTRRAMEKGLRVEHYPGRPDACLLYAPQGLTSAGADKIWKPLTLAPPLLFVRK